MAEHASLFQRKNVVDFIALSPVILRAFPARSNQDSMFFTWNLSRYYALYMTSLARSDAVTNISANFCSTLLPGHARDAMLFEI